MMKRLMVCICAFALAGSLVACSAAPQRDSSSKDSSQNDGVKIGVVFGVGAATRWSQELAYMEQRANELGIGIETRLNTADEPKTWKDDCIELIDSGIDVLIVTPRNVNEVADIYAYAQERGVKLVSYARAVLGSKVDLFVGYDSGRIGQLMGQYLVELVYQGDYIILSGDPADHNATLLYDGAMRFIEPIKGSINVLLDAPVAQWAPDTAKQMVLDAVSANGNKVDAILAPNDKIAGAAIEALKELGVTAPVVVTGMDAELEAAQRIVAGTQSMTVFMDLKTLATTAIDEANRMAQGQVPEVNAKFENGTSEGIDSNLITGKVVARENIDKVLIESGAFTHEQVYGAAQ
ncbi:MAG: substrate-binding domain-containing protein [Raoultibacter sp.]